MPLLFLCNSFGYADSTGRTDETTEVTANALGTYQTGTTGLMIEDDGLMSTIAARYLTAAATDTQFLVELRIDDGVAVQTVGMQELLHTFANQFAQR